jgi:hypothetical protein
MPEAKIKLKLFIICLVVSSQFLLISGCDSKAKEKNSAVTKSQASKTVSDKHIADFQIELLDAAMDVATLIPVKPYIKDRSRAQQAVVEVCLKLDQPVRAVRFSDQIKNWRMGLCYADIAYYLAEEGYGIEQAKKGLEVAEKISNVDAGKKWRTDRIKARIAQAYILLGQPEDAKRFRENLADSEKGKTLQTDAATSDEDYFELQVKALDASIALQNFDITKNALYAYTKLYNRFYDDIERRSMIEDKIKASWGTIPLSIRFDLLCTLAKFSLSHSDNGKMLELMNQTKSLLDDYQWPLQYYIPLVAKLAGLRFHEGDSEQSRADLDAALDLFNNNKSNILNMYRAETLCPLAEGYQLIGDKNKALSVYKQAIEEGVENPNPRPRAEDLSATCCSMALSAAEPDSELSKRIHQIREDLVQSW